MRFVSMMHDERACHFKKRNDMNSTGAHVIYKNRLAKKELYKIPHSLHLIPSDPENGQNCDFWKDVFRQNDIRGKNL